MEQIFSSINTSLVLPNPAHLQPKSALDSHRPRLQGSCRPAFYCWRKERSLFLLVPVRSHRSIASVLGECLRASQLSASCLLFKDITWGLRFSQVCVRKSPSAARPGCCLDHRSKYSLPPVSDTHSSGFPAHSSAEGRGSMAVPCGQPCAPRKTAPSCQESSASTAPYPGQAHCPALGELGQSRRLFSQLAAALSSRCFLSTALSVQRSAAEFHLGRKKFCESHGEFLD